MDKVSCFVTTASSASPTLYFSIYMLIWNWIMVCCSDTHGDRPRSSLPPVPELKLATDITERKGNPAWDYDVRICSLFFWLVFWFFTELALHLCSERNGNFSEFPLIVSKYSKAASCQNLMCRSNRVAGDGRNHNQKAVMQPMMVKLVMITVRSKENVRAKRDL